MSERVQYIQIRKIPLDERIRESPKNKRKIYRLLRKKGYSKANAKSQVNFIINFTITKLPFEESR